MTQGPDGEEQTGGAVDVGATRGCVCAQEAFSDREVRKSTLRRGHLTKTSDVSHVGAGGLGGRQAEGQQVRHEASFSQTSCGRDLELQSGLGDVKSAAGTLSGKR